MSDDVLHTHQIEATESLLSPLPLEPFEGAPRTAPAAAGGPQNLDLLLDVPVPVMVELGRIRLPVGELLQLKPGSVIELERAAHEPVDILANGKLIARGEAVLLDGKLGIRILAIAPQRAAEGGSQASAA